MSGDCHGGGAAGAFYENALAGAELPFVERGASLRGAKPSDGVGSVTVAGSRVELVIGCDLNGSFTSILSEARRLVEREGVDVLVTPDGVRGRPGDSGVRGAAAGRHLRGVER